MSVPQKYRLEVSCKSPIDGLKRTMLREANVHTSETTVLNARTSFAMPGHAVHSM